MCYEYYHEMFIFNKIQRQKTTDFSTFKFNRAIHNRMSFQIKV